MRTMRASRRILMTLPLVLGAVASCVPRSAAQLTVFDPANFQQNLLSAARALEQINNQVRVLQNQVLMIARMDQNLVRLGGTMSPDLQRTLGAIQALLRAGDGIALRLAATQSGYEQLFPRQASAALTHDDALRNAKARWDEQYGAFQRAALLQGQIADGIETDTGLLATAMGRSRDAVGALRSRAGRQRAHRPQRQAGPRPAGPARRAIPRRDDQTGAGPRRRGGRTPALQDLPRHRHRLHGKPMMTSGDPQMPTIPNLRRAAPRFETPRRLLWCIADDDT